MDKNDLPDKNYCTLYIVRHGETEWNVKGVMQGQKDSILTQKGKLQAKELGQKLNGIVFDAVFSSDLSRAKHTAEIIAMEHKLVVQTHKALRERRFGKFEGSSYADYQNELKETLKKYEKLSKEERFRFRVHPTVETEGEAAARFINLLREISIAYLGKTVLVVSHGGTMRILLIHLGYGTPQELSAGVVKNTGYIKLISDGIDFFVKETYGVEKL